MMNDGTDADTTSTASTVETDAGLASDVGVDTDESASARGRNPIAADADASTREATDSGVASPERSDGVVSDPSNEDERSPVSGDRRTDDGRGGEDRDDGDGRVEGDGARAPIDSMSTGALLLNVAFSQGVFGGLVLLGAWYTEIPLAALGVPNIPTLGTLALGVGLGVALYAGNELAAAGANALGFSPPEELRTSLAPDSVAGWALLLCAILPAIAFVEELLFRAALIGALSAGFAVSPWALAVVSSIAFALGHGAQGSLGVVVTGSLGLVLAAAFVLTGSLFVVVLAHYLVNALEFVVHEGLGIEWSE